MQTPGVHERCSPRPNDCRLSLNSYRESALHHQKKFLMLMSMRWMRRTSWSKRRLMHFKVIAGMCHAVEDWPRLVLSICLYGQLVVRLGKRFEGKGIRKSGRCGQHWNGQKERASS